jgi:hypothetical protein
MSEKISKDAFDNWFKDWMSRIGANDTGQPESQTGPKEDTETLASVGAALENHLAKNSPTKKVPKKIPRVTRPVSRSG